MPDLASRLRILLHRPVFFIYNSSLTDATNTLWMSLLPCDLADLLLQSHFCFLHYLSVKENTQHVGEIVSFGCIYVYVCIGSIYFFAKSVMIYCVMYAVAGFTCHGYVYIIIWFCMFVSDYLVWWRGNCFMIFIVELCTFSKLFIHSLHSVYICIVIVLHYLV